VTIADDIARHFIYHMNRRSYGREIDKEMTHQDRKSTRLNSSHSLT
jgi:hypothetical protein